MTRKGNKGSEKGGDTRMGLTRMSGRESGLATGGYGVQSGIRQPECEIAIKDRVGRSLGVMKGAAEQIRK